MDNVPDLAMTLLKSLFAWRAAFIILALINAKNLPFAWHIRIFYHFARNMRRPPGVKKVISQTSNSTTHPVFRPVSIWTSSPLLEIDYNLHKSNSTYFSDMDISRTALVTNLLSAGFRSGNAELERQGHKGPNNVILGSVHTSYHKEIKPYERYEIRSRLLGWDQKWVIILSTFIRPGAKGKPETVLASALSKYVVKKARYTVPPENCLAAAGWFEGMDRPDPEILQVKSHTKGKQKEDEKPKSILKIPSTTLNDTSATNSSSSSSTVMVNRPHEQELEAVDIAKLEAKAEEMSMPANQVDEQWSGTGGLKGSASSPASITEHPAATTHTKDITTSLPTQKPLARRSSGQQWTWEMVEKERLRGLEIARSWMLLDGALALEGGRVQP
jgi:hypothetical protein